MGSPKIKNNNKMFSCVQLWMCEFKFECVRSSLNVYVQVWMCTFKFEYVRLSLNVYVQVWMCTFKFECVSSGLNSKNHVCTCTFVGQRHNQEHPQVKKGILLMVAVRIMRFFFNTNKIGIYAPMSQTEVH